MNIFLKAVFKTFSAIFLVGITAWSTFGQKPGENHSLLKYLPVNQNSDYIIANLLLSADVNTQEVNADLKLINTGSKIIEITGITIYADGGLQTFPIKGNIKQVSLKPGQDKMLSVSFKPVNDIKVFQLTGKQGSIKAKYKVSVFYRQQGNDKAFSVDMIAQLHPDIFKSYISKYPGSFIGYAFNTASAFDQQERKYLETLKLAKTPFVFIAPHELALTGLNIWMTSYCANDTLYADLLIVNHDDFAINLMANTINIGEKNKGPSDLTKKVVIEKVVGSHKETGRIEMGDKILIHFKKYFKKPDGPIFLQIKNAFLLGGFKPLFIDDIGLLKTQLK